MKIKNKIKNKPRCFPQVVLLFQPLLPEVALSQPGKVTMENGKFGKLVTVSFANTEYSKAFHKNNRTDRSQTSCGQSFTKTAIICSFEK